MFDKRTVGLASLLLLVCSTAHAQTRHNVELRGGGGIGAVYLDESLFPSISGSIRIYLAPRVSAESEIIHLSDTEYPHTLFLGKISRDFGRHAYVSAGAGYVVRSRIAGDNGMAWSLGVGWRFFTGTRVFFAPEIAGGTSSLFRATLSVGYSFFQ